MRRQTWLLGWAALLVAAVTVVPVGPVWGQETDPAKTAARAVEAADPDQVDPNIVKGERWTFDFRFGQPQPIIVTTPGGEREVYWYVVYTVINRAEEEKEYIPTFTLFTDTASVRRAGIFPTVFEAIKTSRKIRFLENAVQMHGKLLPGEDNART